MLTTGTSPAEIGPWAAARPEKSRAGGARSGRSSSILRHRLPMRSSPYVGWFRHAPPASPSSRRAGGSWAASARLGGGGGGNGRPRSNSFTSSGSSLGRYQTLRHHHRPAVSAASPPPSAVVSSSLFGYRAPSSVGMKSSPYVGWFRHAPSTRVPSGGKSRAEALEVLGRLSSSGKNSRTNDKADTSCGGLLETTTAPVVDVEMILKSFPISSKAVHQMTPRNRTRYYVDGRLRGGNPNHEENGCGEGIFSFDDEGGSSGDKTHFDHRVFDSIHQSASTRGLHFNDFTQDEEDETHSHSSELRRSSGEVLSSSDDHGSHVDSDGDLPGSPSATIGVLNRLAHWFLFPLAHESGPPYGADFERSADAADELYGHVGPGATTALLPLFSGMLRRALILEDSEAANLDGDGLGACTRPYSRSIAEEGDEGNYSPSEVDSHEGASHSSEDKASAENDDEFSGDRRASASRLLDVSVSSLAEAYYAHQASREFLEAAEAGSSPPPSLSSSPTGQDEYGHHPLDYVITQIDIARMVRNASRHLDVESILSLPTITYKGKKKKKEKSCSGKSGDGCRQQRTVGGKEEPRLAGPNAANPENGDDFAWSWMIVPQDPDAQDAAVTSSPSQDTPKASTASGQGEGTNTNTDADHESSSDAEESDENEHCVICLDHFVEGDRLRVLPCSHLFHAGCIDRWLSGAASDEECFTAGCPTCKERPVAASSASGGGECNGSRGPTSRCGAEEESLLTGGGGGEESAAASSSLDGSVPRWAFARLGNAMAGKAGSCPSHSVTR